MRHTSLILLAGLAFSGTLVAQAPQRGDESDADRAAIVALIERVEEANNSGDVDGWVAAFAPDFVYMPPGSAAVTSHPELVEVAEMGFRNDASIQISPDEIEICGDWAFARSHVTGNVELHSSGEVIPIDMKQLVIYHRSESGQWLIARLIANSNLP